MRNSKSYVTAFKQNKLIKPKKISSVRIILVHPLVFLLWGILAHSVGEMVRNVWVWHWEHWKAVG